MNYIVNLKKPASLRNLSIRLTYYAFGCFSERNKFLIYTIIIVNISIARNQTKSYLILKKMEQVINLLKRVRRGLLSLCLT